MVNRKDRRHSGYFTPNATISRKELIENDLFVNEIYDDWIDHRDGFRDSFGDYKSIKKVNNKRWSSSFEKRIRMNHKQERLLLRRRARQIKMY